ncbi:unc-115 [Pristionchus pacificus]|uniref:Unc-115 protein n=1 Tax=Pristionchus pacificus TaxID=54126 RepID=A0A2A6D127_PRIPA|nr:unc-115 [Pristionchus pacificus]|eukprot:PDM83983.1 unc-115 protein [Pristionchus pacificus]
MFTLHYRNVFYSMGRERAGKALFAWFRPRKKCEVCKKKVSGDALKVNGDKLVHIACFKCTKCARPLSGQRFYPTTDGQFLCQEDFKMVSAQISVQPVETTPKKSTNGQSKTTVTQSPGGTIHQHHAPTSPLGSPSNCAACDQPLQMTQVLFALGQSWHVFCFKCSECAAVLQGEYMASEGKPLCLRDFNEKFGVKCHECCKFIAGKVLQAGAYKFHPTCARCSRCGDHFGDGVEMCMQADEIWHPSCEHARTTENIAPSARAASHRTGNEPKYQTTFGQHHTYMYSLPEYEQTQLKQPIPIHNPQPAQYHHPQAPIKIRKSRMSMLKTGMQRLTEDLDKGPGPRPKSPHMDNEEPIEMAHYPAGHAPEPGTIPAIDRDDFPAPPYPYAVEELKRRLSSSSIENDVSDDEFSDSEKFDEEKMKKTVEKLEQLEVDSSIAAVIKQNIEESNKKQKLPLHWDPRNASRTPSAKKMPHLRFRYDTPINASPSRHMNRPKPWVVWQGGSRDGGATLPCFHLPDSRANTMRACTLPSAYAFGHNLSSGDLHDHDQTISSHYSEHSLAHVGMGGGTTGVGTMRPAAEVKPALRSSLPDMSKPAKIYSLVELQTTNKDLPEEVDRHHLERHLSRDEFENIFGMSPIEFYKLPEWKRINLKRKHKLF